MPLRTLLVANRGEIAVRILRSAAELGLRTVAVHATDDARALHVCLADESRSLGASGPRAYLDASRLLAVARETGCDALHPGYGFLSESAAFAARCADEGLRFVGPAPEALAQFADKAQARALAERCGVPTLPGTSGPTSVAQARELLASLGAGGAVMVKAVAGGGGRGLRPVRDPEALEPAFARCRSEAESAFGNGALYVEQLLEGARHVEVQVVGDGTGRVMSLGERECSLQRRHQKLVEWAPCPWLSPALRERLVAAALRLAAEVRYGGLGTFEFLVGEEAPGGVHSFAFLEANPRLQVEHTVTEEVLGLDLVALQLRLAGGATLDALGLDPARPPAPRGFAVQARVNAERTREDGAVHPSSGTLVAFDVPTGPGVRVDTFAYAGYATSSVYDPLLAKVVAHSSSPDLASAVDRARRALREFRVEGVATNLALLRRLLGRPEVRAGRVHTRFVEEHAAELAAEDDGAEPTLPPFRAEIPDALRAGAVVDAADPLAVLAYGKHAAEAGVAPPPDAPSGTAAVAAPLQGTVVSVAVREGERVPPGAELLVLEAMKMEHVVSAPAGGIVRRVAVTVGDTVREGAVLLFLEEAGSAPAAGGLAAEASSDAIRPDLAEALARHALGRDAARPEAVERRRRRGQRTARENVDDLCDPGSFVEYGALAIAAQRRRRALDDLVRRTPADGLVCGVGRVNGDLFDEARARCVVLAYDYTVLAGTQGFQNHRKKDRMLEIARERRLPLVLFSEGGGGRPGDVDAPGVAGLDCWAFRYFGALSGLVPLVGINSGYCFAGNAALLGSCDVVIATEGSSIGMGGPAMIEGGGLGVFRPDEVGPLAAQRSNGVVDVAVRDESEAVAVAKRYLAYFQGPVADWDCADPRRLRQAVPENRLRVYDVRRVLELLADTGSVLELRRGFGPTMVTALARVEGRPLGVVANDPAHLGGAIDPDGADKAARFLQLCDAFDLPVLFLCDTPGFMVGPEVERRAQVRHAARLFVVGGSLSVPFFTIVLRKGYGLGAQAMAGGSFHAPLFVVSWPTGEFGGMGLEGAVKLGFRDQLAAAPDPAARRKLFEEMVARAYEVGKAVNMASHFEIDDVIDPADSRRWIVSALRGAPLPARRAGKKRPCVDTW